MRAKVARRSLGEGGRGSPEHRFGWQAALAARSLRSLASLVESARADSSGQRVDVAFGELVRNRKVLGLFLIRVFTGPITTLYWFWLPLYLRSGRAMPFAMIGLLGWMPNLFGMTGNVAGGFLTDRLVRLTGSADRGRKLAFTGAFVLSALSMAMPFVASDYVALALMGLALFGNQWVAATYIGTVGDVVPHQLAGRVNGIAGFGDSASVLIAQLAIGFLVDRYSFTPVFIGAGIFPLLALLSVWVVLGRIERVRFGRD